MDHSIKAETTFGDLEVDERFQKLKRSLKLAMLKANHRKMSEEEIDTRVSLPGLSSIDGDAFNSSCTTLCPTSLKSEVLASSNNLRNLLLKKPNFYNTNQKQIATSSVKQYDIKHKNDIDRLIMPPPEIPTVCHVSKKPMNTLSNCENTAPVTLNSSIQSSTANTFSSKSTGMSSNINSDKEYLNTDRVFSNWKVMLDKQLELRVKGTLKCGSRVYSKPIIRRYNIKCVESKFKYKYYLEGNIVDERNDLPDYIRGKFYNGFPDDWENVYQVWRMYFTQGCPVTFHWPTPITDSDDDLISEVTDFTYAYKSKNKVVSTTEHYKSVECTKILEKSINKSLEEKKQHNHSDHYQQNNRNNSMVLKPISEFKENEVYVAQTKLVDIGNNNQMDLDFSSEFVVRKIRYLKDFLQEDQMNIIINNLEHKNCSPIYVNKVLEILDDLDFIMTYRTKSKCDENSVVSASCETSKSEVIPQILVRNDNRANIDKCENKMTEQKHCRYSNDSKYENQIIHTSNYSSNEPEYDNSDQSESIYLGVPKVSFEQVLKTKESLGKTYKRREKKRKVYTDFQKNATNAQNNTENVRCKSVPTSVINSTKDWLSESCVSVTEDEIEVSDMRKNHETERVHKQQETRQQQTIFSNHQENEKNVDTYRKNKPEKHTEDVRCYIPSEIQRSNEYIFVQKQNFPHKVKKNAQFIPDIDYQTTKSDLDAMNVDTCMKKSIRSTTLVSRFNSDQESINTENNNLPKSSHVSQKSHTELAEETKTETAKKLKPTIISSIPVNLNLKICNTSSKSENNSDVSIIVDDRDEQCTNIRPTETSPKKKPISPSVSTNNIRSKTTNDGKREIRSITNDKKETHMDSTKSVTNQNGHLTNNKKETNSTNSTLTRSIKNQNEIYKNVETGPRNTKKLTAWLPKVICYPQSKNELGLIFEGKLLNEAGHVVHRKFSTSVVLKRLSAKLIETVDHQFYELYGSFNDSKHNFPKELARLCRNGCPTKIEEFCLTWKMLNDNVQKVTETVHETSVDLLNTAVSSRGRKLLPPLSYWTGERISLKDNNLVYNPGNSNDSLVSLSERSKTASSIEEKEKSRTDLKKPTKKQDVNRQQVSPKSNTVSDTNKDSTVINGKLQSSGKISTTSKRKKNTRRSAINGKQRIMQQLTYSTSTSSEEEQEPSPLKRARSSRSSINAIALPQQNIKTRQNKQTSSSKTVRHGKVSSTRKSGYEVTCVYYKNVQLSEDFLSEDQASVV